MSVYVHFVQSVVTRENMENETSNIPYS